MVDCMDIVRLAAFVQFRFRQALSKINSRSCAFQREKQGSIRAEREI